MDRAPAPTDAALVATPPGASRPLRVDVWHNILWSRYKAHVLSELHQLAQGAGVELKVFQIAETDVDRKGLSAVDLAAHRYPFALLFQGAYDEVPFWRRLVRTASLVWQSQADLIVVAGYHRPEYMVQILLARLAGRKVAVFCDSTINDHPQRLFKGLVKRLVFGACHAIFCYGERSAAYLRYYGVPEQRIIRRCQAAAVNDGLDPAQRLQRREALRGETGSGSFLYVGRLSPEKGLETLLEAFALVARRHPQWRLRIVGSGPLREALDQRIARAGLQDRVTLVGPLSGAHLWDEYAAASALVLPSRSEPWGLVVNEALAYGCPVVVSEACGCVPELVVSGITGYAFQTDDSEDLAYALQLVVAQDATDDPAQAERRQAVVNQYSPQSAARSILSGCLRVLCRRQPC